MPAPRATALAATMIRPAVPWAASQAAAAPTVAAAGNVIAQATAIRPAGPQRTVVDPRPAPAPYIAPVHTCVVDSGMPRWVEVRMIAALVVSAVKPCVVWMSLIRRPGSG
jgi:hypothetical protein